MGLRFELRVEHVKPRRQHACHPLEYLVLLGALREEVGLGAYQQHGVGPDEVAHAGEEGAGHVAQVDEQHHQGLALPQVHLEGVATR